MHPELPLHAVLTERVTVGMKRVTPLRTVPSAGKCSARSLKNTSYSFPVFSGSWMRHDILLNQNLSRCTYTLSEYMFFP